MPQIDRRTFLRGSAATAGAVMLGGPFQGFVARAANAATMAAPSFPLGPVEDMRDGIVRLWLPRGFHYRSFHDTETPVTLPDGTALPGRHDGMAAFPGPGENVLLVRNHEVNGPGAPFGPGTPYDSAARGGTTTIEVTPKGKVVDAYTSLNGTQMNCSGGPMPWGSWITCEETVNGPDVGPDFTGVSNVPLQQRHGFIFEVPAGGQSTREPITAAGRFAHESVAFDPIDGILYLTEDNFGFPSGFYRYIPASNPMESGSLDNEGQLQMLAVAGQPNLDLAVDAGRRVRRMTSNGSTSTTPHPRSRTPRAPPRPRRTIRRSCYVGNQGRAQGAAYFSRLEGSATRTASSTSLRRRAGGPRRPSIGPIADGYGNGSGQVWGYSTQDETLQCVFQSPGAAVLDFPDNVTTSPRGTLILCEDSTGDNYLRGLTTEGQLFDVALNRLVSRTGTPRFGDEFAGSTFSPDGSTLFVNIQASAGMTFAIWGPWARIGV